MSFPSFSVFTIALLCHEVIATWFAIIVLVTDKTVDNFGKLCIHARSLVKRNSSSN